MLSSASESKTLINGRRFRHALTAANQSTKHLKRGELYRRVKTETRVDDVIPKSADATIASIIDEKCNEWRQLDSMYINQHKTHGRPGQASGSHMAVPQGMDIIGADRANINKLRHHKVAPDDGPVYFSKLLDIFEDMPRRANLSDVDISSHFNQSTADKIESAVEGGDEASFITTEEVIVTVTFHSSYNESTRTPTKHQEIEILGRQTLSELRDRVYCLSDYSEHTGNDSFFFIEGVFYMDDRTGSASEAAYAAMLDNIQQIHRWLLGARISVYQPSDVTNVNTGEQDDMTYTTSVRGRPYHEAEPDIRSMYDTAIEDLHLSLGSKYLFCHDNHCEHFVYFSDLRAFNNHFDENYWTSYPKVVDQMKLVRRKCGICDLLPAKHVVFGDRLSPQNPYFCCEQCEFMLHYSNEGVPLYRDYRIFPYFHDVPP